MSQSNEQLEWVVNITWDKDYYVIAHVRNERTQSIKPEIHNIPGYNRNLEKDPCKFCGDPNLKVFLNWLDQICPNKDKSPMELITKYVKEQKPFDIWFTFRTNIYSISIGDKIWWSETLTSDRLSKSCSSTTSSLGEAVDDVKIDSEAVDQGKVDQLRQRAEELEKKRENLPAQIAEQGIRPTIENDIRQLQATHRERENAWAEEKKELEEEKKELERKYENDIRQLQATHRERENAWAEEKKELNKKIDTYGKEIVNLLKGMEQVEKDQKNFIGRIGELQRETDEKLERHCKSMEVYQNLLQSLNMEDDLLEKSSGLEEASNGLDMLKKQLEKMNSVEYLTHLRDRDIEKQFDQLSQKAKAEVRWDSVLMGLLKRLRDEGEKNVLRIKEERQDEKLRDFVRERGFELIWPKVGDELVMREHQILREEVAEGVGRGRVVRVLAPGLRRGEEVLLKAGVVLAR